MIKLKTLREQNNLTQRSLAEKINVTHGAIGNWEMGKRDPDISTLVKIAEYFGVSIDYLVGHSSEPYDVSTPAPSDEYTDAEKRVIAAYRTLVPGMQDYILEMIEKLADVDTGENKGKKVNRA